MSSVWHRHVWVNRLQSAVLVLFMLGLLTLLGAVLLGRDGAWMTLGAGLIALILEPAASSRLTLRMYRALPIRADEAPQLWLTVRTLAARAGLPAQPTLHYVPSAVANAFAVGNARACAIALSDGLLRGLSPRELTGVLAHEIAHVAHGDLRVMGLADYLSRLTSLLALMGYGMLLATVPLLLLGDLVIDWRALGLLILAPQLALLAQLGLSRVREFEADMAAVALTGDPQGLIAALRRIDQESRGWREILMPGLGNSEPSWLRTHPALTERIRRLMTLQPADQIAASGAHERNWLTTSLPERRRRVGDLRF
ncbi:MAG: M48 family metalloprotease [Rhodocyclales bacterium]|nr:M48 family metalloprotease [Rhodocyclales bacterium]